MPTVAPIFSIVSSTATLFQDQRKLTRCVQWSLQWVNGS